MHTHSYTNVLHTCIHTKGHTHKHTLKNIYRHMQTQTYHVGAWSADDISDYIRARGVGGRTVHVDQGCLVKAVAESRQHVGSCIRCLVRCIHPHARLRKLTRIGDAHILHARSQRTTATTDMIRSSQGTHHIVTAIFRNGWWTVCD